MAERKGKGGGIYGEDRGNIGSRVRKKVLRGERRR